jgi:hypothetical protein
MHTLAEIEQRIWYLFVTGQTDHLLVSADDPDDAR